MYVLVNYRFWRFKVAIYDSISQNQLIRSAIYLYYKDHGLSLTFLDVSKYWHNMISSIHLGDIPNTVKHNQFIGN